MNSFNPDMLAWTTLSSTHPDSHDSQMLAPTTLTSTILQLWQAHSHNYDILTHTTLTSSLTQLWHAHFHTWYASSHNSDKLTFKTLTCLVSPLWHAHSHLCGNLASLVAETVDSLWAGNKCWILLCSDMLTLSYLTIWLCWEQACSGASGFAGRCESGFAGSSGTELTGSTLVGVDVALLVEKNLDLLWAGNKLGIWLHMDQAGSIGSALAPTTLICSCLVSLLWHGHTRLSDDQDSLGASC